MNNTMEDKTLITRFQNGDKEAFTQLYGMYSKQLYLNLVKLVKSEEIAAELLQDVFIVIWEKRDTIEIQQSFRAYLFRIGENKVIDLFRRARRDKLLFSKIKKIATEHYTHIEEDLIAREDAAILKKAIETLPPQRRQIFELCKLQGKTYTEVSSQLGISISTINDHIVKGTKTVREFLYSNKQYSTSILLFFLLKDI
ncbi:MAG TPA: RNA polymerase sigma-70 factor [Flavisolibacter sp.]|nr:RNA polymerase sigma-70 factor [Flavisolibacter sp.]